MAYTRRKHGLLFAVLLALAAPALAQAQAAKPPYDHPLFTGPSHEAPVARFDQEHLRLGLQFDLTTRRIFGDARFRLTPIGSDQYDTIPDPVLFFAAGLTIDSVRIGPSVPLMRNAPFHTGSADSLIIAFDSLYVPGAPFEVHIHYKAQPHRGLFFVQPNPQIPDQKHQIWTRSTPGATRHWIPVLDGPGDMMTSELLITADSSLLALSNGRRVEALANDDGTVTTYYRQDRPHTLHRLMLTLGDYAVHQGTTDVADRLIPLSYWVNSSQTDNVARTFGQTPDMIRFFMESTGVPFPWTSYNQVVLHQFYGTGQANTGISAFPGHVMLDARAALTENKDLIAQMLARQWFGGLVTARSWADIWLDEGFAAYLSVLFMEQHQSPNVFALAMLDFADQYLDEAQRYRRPLVWNRWRDPSDMLDAHSAQKGAWVLHMLRRRIGDRLFRNVMEQYLTTHAFNLVDTNHLHRIVEDVTGEDVDAFFAQWIAAAGHPILDVRYTYDADEGALIITVAQQQEGYLVPEVFRTNLVLEAHTLTDAHRFEVTLEADSQMFTVPLSVRPRFLLFDPDHDVLAEVQVHQPARAWMGQLRHAPQPVNRILAARALTTFADDPALLVGLRSAVREEPSAAVRKAIAETISHFPPSMATQRLLIGMMDDQDAIVRTAVLNALGVYENIEPVQDLAFQAAQNDPSYTVQAEAVKTLARTASPIALDVARSALITPSHRDIIRRAAFEVLPLLDIPLREGVALGLEYSASTQPSMVRRAAIHYLHTLAPDTREALNRLIALLNDDDINVRRAAIESLGLVGSDHALEALKQHQAIELQPALQATLNQILHQHTTPNP